MTLTYIICVLASEGVSKETIESNFLNRIYQEEYKITIDVDLPLKTTKNKINFQFWISSYKSLTNIINWEKFISKKIRGSNGIIIIYDTANIETLNWASSKIQLINNNLQVVPPILLVGNNLNHKEHRKVSKEQIKKVKEINNLSSTMEISLETGENVEKMFMELTGMMLKNAKPDYRIEAKRINIKRLISPKVYRYAFLLLVLIILISIIGSLIMYFIL